MKLRSKIFIIAGSDSSGGAGIQADIKTATSLGVYAMTAITAVTVQNTTGVKKVVSIPANEIYHQIVYTSKDIKPDAIKIGMLHSTKIINKVFTSLSQIKTKKIILDPVMVAKGGHALLDLNIIECLKKELLPKCFLITPNLPEAENLLNTKIKSSEDMKVNIENFKSLNIKNALLKGGHLDENMIIDLLYTEKKIYKFISNKIRSTNTHGTGCTLASAIACNLYKKVSLPKSVSNARDFVIRGIKKASIIGNGHNPLHHFL